MRLFQFKVNFRGCGLQEKRDTPFEFFRERNFVQKDIGILVPSVEPILDFADTAYSTVGIRVSTQDNESGICSLVKDEVLVYGVGTRSWCIYVVFVVAVDVAFDVRKRSRASVSLVCERQDVVNRKLPRGVK